VSTTIHQEKRCQTCKKHLPIDSFNKKRTNPDGLQKTCRACQAVERKSYYDRNKDKEFATHATYVNANKDKVNAKRCETRAMDPDFYKRRQVYVEGKKARSTPFLVFHRYGKRIQRALAVAKAVRAGRDRALLGCDDDVFIQHLEASFTDGMTWEKYAAGDLQIDHIIPCSCFDLTYASHQFVCFNYRNTRMLWASDNVGRTKNSFLSHEEVQAIVDGWLS